MDPAPVPTIQLNLVQTLGVGAFMYAIGVALRARVQFFNRLNIPSAVLGGLLFALTVLVCHDRRPERHARPDRPAALHDHVLHDDRNGGKPAPAEEGGASGSDVSCHRSSVLFPAELSREWGSGRLFGAHPLLGVMAGSVTLVGGPATGLAFAPLFEQAGLQGAAAVAIASATFGITLGGLVAGPVGTWVIERHRLRGRASTTVTAGRRKRNRARPISWPRRAGAKSRR